MTYVFGQTSSTEPKAPINTNTPLGTKPVVTTQPTGYVFGQTNSTGQTSVKSSATTPQMEDSFGQKAADALVKTGYETKDNFNKISSHNPFTQIAGGTGVIAAPFVAASRVAGAALPSQETAKRAVDTLGYGGGFGKAQQALEKTTGKLSDIGSPIANSPIVQNLAVKTADKYGALSPVTRRNIEESLTGIKDIGLNTASIVGGVEGLGLARTGLTALKAPVTGAVKTGLESTRNFVIPSQTKLGSKLDNHIKDIYKGTTGDVQSINEEAFKTRKGLELLNKEANNIEIPDTNAPLGSNKTKPYNSSNSKPNEFISAVKEIDKKIVVNGRTAADNATKAGHQIDTSSDLNIIDEAVTKGEITPSAGDQMKRQITSKEGKPLGVHDWVQDVNKRYYDNKGNPRDTANSIVANKVADSLRAKLNGLVDRKGYAEAYANNQSLKKAIITLAKKANKGVNFGDIATDAGIDAAFAVVTGNPLFMARTVGTGLFKGIIGGFRNQAGFRNFKKAVNITKKLPTNTKLPSTEVKIQSSQDIAKNLNAITKTTIPKNIIIPKTIPQTIKKGKGITLPTVSKTVTKPFKTLQDKIYDSEDGLLSDLKMIFAKLDKEKQENIQKDLNVNTKEELIVKIKKIFNIKIKPKDPDLDKVIRKNGRVFYNKQDVTDLKDMSDKEIADFIDNIPF